MSVNTKMTAIADEVRELSGANSLMGLDTIKAHLTEANAEIAIQETALAETVELFQNKIFPSALQNKTVNPSINNITVVPDEGYNGLSSVTINAIPTISQAIPIINVDSMGMITSEVIQPAGYVETGATSATKQLNSQEGQIIIPSTTDQIIANGYYLTGDQVVKGDVNLIADNIKAGVSIFGVEGTSAGSFPNGTEWTQSNINTGNFTIVKYANGIWVAGSYENGVYYSTDGKNWYQSNITSNEIRDFYNANGMWIVAGRIGLYYSFDGMTWTKIDVAGSFGSLYYANGIWTAGSIGNQGIYYSTDGMLWSKSDHTSGHCGAIKYANGIWVADNYGDGLIYSMDGMHWLESNIVDGWYDILYHENGLWVAGGYLSGLYYSTDGMTWTSSNISSTDTCYYVQNAKGIWVAGVSAQGLYYSTDGMTWTKSHIATTGGIQDVYNANGVWVASIYNDGTWYSLDGMNWNRSNLTVESIKSACCANGIWAAGSNNGLYYSIAWQP